MEDAEIRLLILQKLLGAHPYAVPEARITTQLQASGCRLEGAVLKEHLRCLADERLAAHERGLLDPGQHCWRLTERGRGWLAALQFESMHAERIHGVASLAGMVAGGDSGMRTAAEGSMLRPREPDRSQSLQVLLVDDTQSGLRDRLEQLEGEVRVLRLSAARG